MQIDAAYLALAFHEGLVGDARLVHRSAGQLALPSGRLVACDPFVCWADAEPFTTVLPAGTYPVTLVVAQVDTDERVAFARLDLSPTIPVRWSLMVAKGQDPDQLGPDEIFGYGVDAGTGCFADQASMREFARQMDAEEDYWEKIQSEMERTYVHTWSWVNWALPRGLNVVAFSSGFGDGLYPTYVGADADGVPVAVVTDFIVLPIADNMGAPNEVAG